MLPVATVVALVDELVEVELLVELPGLEEHAASASESAKPTRRTFGMRSTAPTTFDAGPAVKYPTFARMNRVHCSC